ncbi:AAA family ATPase [Rhizobacter sp. P5_C2]
MTVLNIPRFQIEDALYEPYPLERYRGNPLVEALRLSKLTKQLMSKDSLHRALEHYPEKPGASTRRASDFYRETELDNIADIVLARPAYRQAVTRAATTLMNTYAHREPLSVEGVAQRYDLALLESKDVFLDNLLNRSDRFAIGQRGAAGGYAIFGSTGSGKTTLLHAIAKLFGKVIRHKVYAGKELNLLQIPLLQVSVPHDASIRAFILQFTAVVDYHLGEPLYERQVRGLKTIGDAALLMMRICAAINLGALIVDDLQNLRAARGPGVEVALNLLALLIDFGTSVITSATPAVGALLTSNARNTRKLVSNGYTELLMMPAGSEESRNYQKAYWPYQYTSTFTRLTPKIRKAWETAGAGNPAFSTLAFKLVQSRLIGEEREVITPGIFEHVAHIDMALLKPAIDALNSNDPFLLARFDDLVFKDELKELFTKIKMELPQAPADPKAFDDEPDDKPSPRRYGKPAGPIIRKIALPTEDPLALMTRD